MNEEPKIIFGERTIGTYCRDGHLIKEKKTGEIIPFSRCSSCSEWTSLNANYCSWCGEKR